MAAHQAPPSLGFSRQEHWNGLPFPSPRHESEKWKWSRSVVSKSMTPVTVAYQAPPSMGFSRQEYYSGVPLPSPKEISSLSYSIVFLYFFALITEEGFLMSPCYSLELCIQIEFTIIRIIIYAFILSLLHRSKSTFFFISSKTPVF